MDTDNLDICTFTVSLKRSRYRHFSQRFFAAKKERGVSLIAAQFILYGSAYRGLLHLVCFGGGYLICVGGHCLSCERFFEFDRCTFYIVLCKRKDFTFSSACTAVSLTASLLNELTKNNVKVIFCDEKCNPVSELLPYYGAHNTSRRYKEQFLWDKEIKARIWRKIVQKKIEEQSSHLFDRGFIEQSEMLKEYALQVCDNDYTNREGHAAKVYFRNLIHGDFSCFKLNV